VSEPSTVYTPRSDATPEGELSVLAAVFKFALDCHARKRGRLPDKSGPDDAEGPKNDRTATDIVPERP
jgi:hypothetical protein